MGHIRVDTVSARAAAQYYDNAAYTLENAVTAHLLRLGYSAQTAGYRYGASGDAIRIAMDRLAAAVTQWSRAAAEIAVVIRTEVDRYVAAELRITAALQ